MPRSHNHWDARHSSASAVCLSYTTTPLLGSGSHCDMHGAPSRQAAQCRMPFSCQCHSTIVVVTTSNAATVASQWSMKPTLAANSPRQMQTPFASVRNGRVCSSPFTRSAAEKTLHAMHVQYSMQSRTTETQRSSMSDQILWRHSAAVAGSHAGSHAGSQAERGRRGTRGRTDLNIGNPPVSPSVLDA